MHFVSISVHYTAGLAEALAGLRRTLVAAHLQPDDRLALLARLVDGDVGDVPLGAERHALLRRHLVRAHLETDDALAGLHLLLGEVTLVLLRLPRPEYRSAVAVHLSLENVDEQNRLI